MSRSGATALEWTALRARPIGDIALVGLVVRNDIEDDALIPKIDQVAILEKCALLNTLAVDLRPIRAAQILHVPAAFDEVEVRVIARDRAACDHEIIARSAPDCRGVLMEAQRPSGQRSALWRQARKQRKTIGSLVTVRAGPLIRQVIATNGAEEARTLIRLTATEASSTRVLIVVLRL